MWLDEDRTYLIIERIADMMSMLFASISVME